MKLFRNILGILLCCVFTLKAQNVTNKKKSDSLFSLIKGTYKSSFYCDQVNTGMDGKKARSYLNKEISFTKNNVKLFDESLININYSFLRVSKIDYLYYLHKLNEFNCIDSILNKDSLDLIVINPRQEDTEPPVDIIVTNKYLAFNYLGFYYFFRRDQNKINLKSSRN